MGNDWFLSKKHPEKSLYGPCDLLTKRRFCSVRAPVLNRSLPNQFPLNNFQKPSTSSKRIFKSSNGSRFWKISCRGHGSIPVGNFKKSLNFKYFFCVGYNFAFMTDIQTQLFQKISKISQDLVIFTFSPSFVFQAKPHVFMRWDRRRRKIHQFDASHVHINPWEPAFF